MKKNLLIIALTFSIGNVIAQGQIGNGNMESWELINTSDSEPSNWNSFLTAGGAWNTFAANQVESSTDVRPGTTGAKSARIWSTSTTIPFVGTVIANGNLTLGKINMGSTTPTNANNYNASITAEASYSETLTDTPDSIVFWANFTPNGHSQNARMKATLHTNNDYRDPEDAASTGYVVATAVKNYPATAGWKRISTPFVYSGTGTNTHILVTFTTNETPGGGAGDDIILIDDVELIYNPASINENEYNSVSLFLNNESNKLNFVVGSDVQGEYSVYNVSGVNIQNGMISKSVNFDLPSGVYIVKTLIGNHVTTTKVYKK